MDENKQNEENSKTLITDITSAGTPEIYANGFSLGAGNADIVIVLQRNGKSVQTLNISFTLAKTLVNVLSDTIQLVEKNTGMNIKTTFQIDSSMGENKNES